MITNPEKEIKKVLIICLDVRPALKGMTGVGTYIYYLCSALIKHYPAQYFKLFTSSLKDRFQHKMPKGSYRLYDRHIPVKVTDFAFETLRFPPMQFFTGGFDLYHSPSPVLPPLMKCAKVVTVHDHYFLKAPACSQKASRDYFKKYIRKHLEASDHIICVSRYTAQEVIDFFSMPASKISTIYHGADHIPSVDGRVDQPYVGKTKKNKISKEGRRACIRRLGLRDSEHLILFVGTIEPRKNPQVLLESLELLLQKKVDANLVFAGGAGWGADDFIEKLEKSAARERIVVTGYQEREELNEIYNYTDVLVMPSRDEGFGLPVIEAMRSGVPVIASRNGALPEIGADAALYFDGDLSEELSSLLLKVLGDSELRRKMIEKGYRRSADFSWDKAAKETMSVYKKVL